MRFFGFLVERGSDVEDRLRDGAVGPLHLLAGVSLSRLHRPALGCAEAHRAHGRQRHSRQGGSCLGQTIFPHFSSHDSVAPERRVALPSWLPVPSSELEWSSSRRSVAGDAGASDVCGFLGGPARMTPLQRSAPKQNVTLTRSRRGYRRGGQSGPLEWRRSC